MKRIAVLGGTGFVGSNVVDVLKASGHECAVLSRQTGTDLSDLNAANEALKDGYDVVVNCASNVGSLNYVTEKAADVIDSNARMILNIYRALSVHSPKSVVINPIANCGFPGDLNLYKESRFWDGPVHPSVLSYGTTRRFLLTTSKCYRMQHGIRSINYFAPNMYGKHDSADPNKAHALNALIGRFLRAKIKKEPCMTLWGTGKPVREWLYAGDFAKVIAATIARADELRNADDINIGQKSGYSIKKIAEIIKKTVGHDLSVKWDTSKQDGAPVKIMDNALFKKRFPDFKFTTLEQGITETIDYYQSLGDKLWV